MNIHGLKKRRNKLAKTLSRIKRMGRINRRGKYGLPRGVTEMEKAKVRLAKQIKTLREGKKK